MTAVTAVTVLPYSRGCRKLVAKKHSGRVQWAPDGQHAIYFNGKDWILITATGGYGAPRLVPVGAEDFSYLVMPIRLNV